MKKFKSFLLLCLLSISTVSCKKADLVVFSFDRPLQLDVLLGSIKQYVTGLGDVFIIYRSSDQFFQNGFEKVKAAYPECTFTKQSDNPKADFKPLVLEAIYEKGKENYVFFAVDDQVFTDYVDLSYCIEKIERYKAYAFYLRLGMHFDWCYSAQVAQTNPIYQEVEKDLCFWTFKNGTYEFCYPHDTVSALYSKAVVKDDLYRLNYSSPNTMEGSWAAIADNNKQGLCFMRAKTLMLPINKVQTDNGNIAMNVLTAEQLNKKYLEGYVFDVAPLFQVSNNACCYEYVPAFIERNV